MPNRFLLLIAGVVSTAAICSLAVIVLRATFDAYRQADIVLGIGSVLAILGVVLSFLFLAKTIMDNMKRNKNGQPK